MKSSEIRSQFLGYFAARGHTVVASSPLVPANDPTLLFTNSGMVQFKEVFLGKEQRSYRRAASSQRSVRAGGKHNDLENVGYTARHHTFFEMLGNFSFGDYFKRDAIVFAWDLLTRCFGIAPERLWITVYKDDDEAHAIWANEVGVPAERIIRIGDNKGARYASDNFWQMADTGPCGPCSEIFYDHGPRVAGGPPGSAEEDGDRYIEIWNLVFMQYERDHAGVLTPLPRPCVDTGMGLERIAAVLQQVHSNYDIDLFQTLVAAAARATGARDRESPSLRVIADHIRACAFLVVDGVIPGNEGRGYVLRRIIRRALRHGHQLGCDQPFFHTLVHDLAGLMGEAYPELVQASERVREVLRQEEERFSETLKHGLQLLEQVLAPHTTRLDGETAFRLYDTYGFPLDLTADICRERGVSVDEAGFHAAMQRQREQARAAGKFKASADVDVAGQITRFSGYAQLQAEASVVAIVAHGEQVERVSGGRALIVLDQTPFYAESGGQVGDRGWLTSPHGFSARVDDTRKLASGAFGHEVALEAGSVAVGDRVLAQVDPERRARTMRHHSATHLMHKALREVLGAHVQQRGSLVDDQRTRFDFSHAAPLSAEQLRAVEERVNTEILQNHATTARVMAFDEAVRSGATALFGEKYAQEVRVLQIGSSRELCGGTHVAHTGEIGLFKIVAESGVAAGIRRIEAVSGDRALQFAQGQEQRLEELAQLLRAPVHEVGERVGQVLEQLRGLERELAQLKSRLAAAQGDELLGKARRIGPASLLVARLDAVDARGLRDTIDQLKARLGTAVIVLGVVEGNKVSLVAGVTADLTSRLKAGELVNFVAQQVGGRGGGRADMAQAGGTQPAALPDALASVEAWVSSRIREA
ncbi:MAG: alanine--tRNA ligase [Betaproteobacteria bacterium]|nr:alanine--tRNA ligase [Betaproteobacteria bacterium]